MNKIAILFAIATIVSCTIAAEADPAWELAGCAFTGPVVSGAVYIGLTNAAKKEYTVWSNLTGSGINTAGSHAFAVLQYGDLNATGKIFAGPTEVFTCSPPSFIGDLGNWESTVSGIDSKKTFTNFALNGANSLVGRVLAIYSTPSTCAPPAAKVGDTPADPANIIAKCVVGKINANSTLPKDVLTALPTAYSGTVSPAQATGNAAHNNPNNAAKTTAVCYLTSTGAPTFGDVNGTVTLTLNADNSITYLATVKGLDTSKAHGIHIHGFGDLRVTLGSSTGGHWKSGAQTHALPENNTRELGDLGNICVTDSQGTMYYNYTTSYSGSFSTIDNALGRAIVVHAIRDYGNATDLGARLSQCVVGLGNVEAPATITFNPNIVGKFEDEPICPVATPSPTPTASEGTTTSTATITVVSSIILVAITLLSLIL
eukprot:gene12643-14851_t